MSKLHTKERSVDTEDHARSMPTSGDADAIIYEALAKIGIHQEDHVIECTDSALHYMQGQINKPEIGEGLKKLGMTKAQIEKFLKLIDEEGFRKALETGMSDSPTTDLVSAGAGSGGVHDEVEKTGFELVYDALIAHAVPMSTLTQWIDIASLILNRQEEAAKEQVVKLLRQGISKEAISQFLELVQDFVSRGMSFIQARIRSGINVISTRDLSDDYRKMASEPRSTFVDPAIRDSHVLDGILDGTLVAAGRGRGVAHPEIQSRTTINSFTLEQERHFEKFAKEYSVIRAEEEKGGVASEKTKRAVEALVRGFNATIRTVPGASERLMTVEQYQARRATFTDDGEIRGALLDETRISYAFNDSSREYLKNGFAKDPIFGEALGKAVSKLKKPMLINALLMNAMNSSSQDTSDLLSLIMNVNTRMDDRGGTLVNAFIIRGEANAIRLTIQTMLIKGISTEDLGVDGYNFVNFVELAAAQSGSMLLYILSLAYFVYPDSSLRQRILSEKFFEALAKKVPEGSSQAVIIREFTSLIQNPAVTPDEISKFFNIITSSQLDDIIEGVQLQDLLDHSAILPAESELLEQIKGLAKCVGVKSSIVQTLSPKVLQAISAESCVSLFSVKKGLESELVDALDTMRRNEMMPRVVSKFNRVKFLTSIYSVYNSSDDSDLKARIKGHIYFMIQQECSLKELLYSMCLVSESITVAMQQDHEFMDIILAQVNKLLLTYRSVTDAKSIAQSVQRPESLDGLSICDEGKELNSATQNLIKVVSVKFLRFELLKFAFETCRLNSAQSSGLLAFVGGEEHFSLYESPMRCYLAKSGEKQAKAREFIENLMSIGVSPFELLRSNKATAIEEALNSRDQFLIDGMLAVIAKQSERSKSSIDVHKLKTIFSELRSIILELRDLGLIKVEKNKLYAINGKKGIDDKALAYNYFEVIDAAAKSFVNRSSYVRQCEVEKINGLFELRTELVAMFGFALVAIENTSKYLNSCKDELQAQSFLQSLFGQQISRYYLLQTPILRKPS